MQPAFKAAVIAAALPMCVLLARAAEVSTAAAGHATPAYTSRGELVMPADYRTWTFITSNINMGYPSEGPRPPDSPTTFGNLFVNPEAYTSFMKTGTWPDRTVLMIEIRESGNTPALNTASRFQTDVRGFEFHVKDAARGGWTFYFIRPGKTSGKAFARTESCYACHEKNAAVDTTFVQYYPPLVGIAKAKGTFKKTAE